MIINAYICNVNYCYMGYQEMLAENIRNILKDRGLKQSDIAESPFLSETIISKTLNGSRKMTADDIANFAKVLSIREIDILTYPDVYVKKEYSQSDPIEAILQIKLKKDKKDQVLKLVFGDNDIEILNK